jgi:AraC family L-rhamnose operon transcriptional activator RhaR
MSSSGLRRYDRAFVFPSGHTPINVLSTIHNGVETPHDHDFVEVVIVAGGRATHHTIEGRGPIGRGDAFVLRPGTWHAYERCEKLSIYNVCFGAELLRRELAWMIDDPRLGHLFWSGPLGANRYGFIGLKMPDAGLRRSIKRAEALRSSVQKLPANRAAHLGELLLLLDEIGIALGSGPREPRHAAHPAVAQSMKLLEEDLTREWTLADLSDRVLLDPSYLVRLFRAATGLPPMAYLARCRAERAAGLLLKTDRSIADIGADVGWSEPYYFARRFKSHFGMSASEYRHRSGI